MRPFQSSTSMLLAVAVILCSPPGAMASVSPDRIGLPHAQPTIWLQGPLATSSLEVFVPVNFPSSAELSLEEAMALCLDGDVPSCMLARLAVIGACGATVVLAATPLPGDELVAFIACNAAFMYWVEECVNKRYED